jgi:Flp pilus assembly protein TadG
MKVRFGGGLRRGERGSVLVLTAVALPVLIGFAALALDIGYIYDYRQGMGAAADAAAISGAFEVKKNSSISQTSLESYARDDAMRNGFLNGLNNISVAVTRGTYSGGAFTAGSTATDKFVQVVITRPVPTFLMGVIGWTSMTTSVTSIAGPGDSSSGCVYALNTADAKYTTELDIGYSKTGSVNINTSKCGVISNGNFAVGSGSSVTASEIDVTASSGTINGTATPTPSYDVAQSDDPFADLDEAGLFGTSPACATGWTGTRTTYSGGVGTTTAYNYDSATRPTFNSENRSLGTDHYVLNPGVYCGGIKIGGGTIVSSGTTSPLCTAGIDGLVTFTPGTYIIVGSVGLNWIHICTAGTGVTFYLTGNATYPYTSACGNKVFSSDPPARYEFYAPTTGDYQGLLLIQDRTQATSCGSSPPIVDFEPDAMIIDGAIYYPNHHVAFGAATSSSGAYTILIAGTIAFTGTAQLRSDFTTLGGVSPIKRTGIAY